MRLPLPVFLIVFLLISISIQAQTDAQTRYEQESIGFYGNKYIRNGNILSFRELSRYLNSFPEPALEYKLAKQKNTTVGILLAGTLVCYIAALTQINKNDDLALGLGIAGLSLNIIALPISSRAQKHTQHAVWLYNRDILPK
jgi:hypothetical protein